MIGDSQTNEDKSKISISSIVRNKYQPRKKFDKESLEELSNSIKENGISIKPKQIKVKYKLINKNANLDLYIEGYDGLDQRYISIAFIFLDNLFGEFFVMNNINEIAFKPMLGSESELITLEVLKKQLVKELK